MLMESQTHKSLNKERTSCFFIAYICMLHAQIDLRITVDAAGKFGCRVSGRTYLTVTGWSSKRFYVFLGRSTRIFFFFTFLDITMKMLLDVIVICVLVVLGAAYFVSRKTWYVIGITLIHQIKYYYIGVIYCFDDILNAKNNKTDLPSVPNKIAIVTGGSRGIGAEVVKKLLQCDMEVIIACRSTIAGEKLIAEIRKSGIVSGRAKVYKLDNCSLESIREFAKKIKTDYDKIHILINNAGVMFIPTYRETKDGFEEQWAVNYLSHFLLTSLLLPLLKAGGHPGDCSRIINVTSVAHYVSDIDFASINNSSKNTFFTHAAYGQSKLAQTTFTITLQKLLTDKSLNVLVYSVHPGIVSTDLFKDTILGKNKWLMFVWKTPEQGALPVIYTALNKDIERKGGIYISNCKESALPSVALEEQIQKQLFELSLKQVRLNDFFQHL